MTDRFDVVVIGGGAAGCTAALHADELGASVALLEAEPALGGSTARSGGYVFAAGTDVQRAAGVDDDADAMAEYMSLVQRWTIAPPLVRALCDDSAWAVGWLGSLGVEFRVDDLVRTGMERVRRGHRASGGGAMIAERLERACRARDIEVAVANPVEGLVVEAGRVVGVRVGGHEVRAGAVVVAAGGFGHEPALLAAHFPSAAAAGEWTWSIAGSGSTGSSIRLGRQVGAAFAGHDHGLAVPVPAVVRTTTATSPWVTLVDREGRRFLREDAYHSVLAAAIGGIGGTAFAVFDDRARRDAPPDPAYGDLLGPDGGAHRVPGARVWSASSIDELARHTGMRPQLLAHTVATVNEHRHRGCDVAHGKDASHLRSIVDAPFFAVEVRPALVALTGYGMCIDDQARVLDEADRPIGGLYAAGEATGNVLGPLYIGSGSSLTSCVVFGRRAGLDAARAALGVTRNG